MTKKHFEAIATVVSELRDFPIANSEHDEAVVQRTLDVVAEAMARVFANANGRFDKGRFIRACGKGGK